MGAPGHAVGLRQNVGAVYIFNRDQKVDGAWVETAILLAPDDAPALRLGASVALDGNTLIAGAPSNGIATGTAHIFERSATDSNDWRQTATLRPPAGIDPLYFGWSVDISGDIAVVGSVEEQAFVYLRDRGGTDQWGLFATLTASGREPLGDSVALSGQDAVFGSFSFYRAGVADVFLIPEPSAIVLSAMCALFGGILLLRSRSGGAQCSR